MPRANPSTILLICGVVLASPFLAGKSNNEKEEKKSAAVASIRPHGKIKKADLPAATKINFETALHAALAAVPGDVVKAELEIEDGNLMYSFEIVGADHKIKEVEIDAGDGKVLDIDND